MSDTPQLSTLAETFLRQEPDPAPVEAVERLFGPSRRPGTTSIGARKRRPDLFQDTLDSPAESYAAWLDRTVRKACSAYLQAAASNGLDLPESLRPRDVVRAVASLLEAPTPDGHPLCEAIPQQMVEDVMLRLVAGILNPESPPREVHLYRTFNALCHRIGLALLDRMEGSGDPIGSTQSVDGLIRVAVLSGAVGINCKSSASAASALLNRDRLPIPRAWTASLDNASAVSRRELSAVAGALLDLAESPGGGFALSALPAYRREVVGAEAPTALVFFGDDYLESLVDLRRFEVMLARNPNLRMLFIPRNGRYGNDLAFADIGPILEDRRFSGLRRLAGAGRIRFSPNGPRAGCVDPRDLSRGLLAEIEAVGAGRRVILETKGCRNFEMLQGGLPVVWYAAFNCNRALSIRTVGVDGPPVFLRIPPGLRAYDGFEDPRIGLSRSYGTAGVRFARMTTRGLCRALESPLYRALQEDAGQETSLNYRLTALADRRGLTFADLFRDDRPSGVGRRPCRLSMRTESAVSAGAPHPAP